MQQIKIPKVKIGKPFAQNLINAIIYGKDAEAMREWQEQQEQDKLTKGRFWLKTNNEAE